MTLQAVWLFNVYKYKSQELNEKTRDAVLATITRLQKEEDAKLILQNIDSLLITDNIIGSETKSGMRVIVSNIKNKIKVDTLNWEEIPDMEKKINFVSDTNETTTIVKMESGDTKKVIIHSESVSTHKTKKKAKELESLFLKMAARSNNQSRTLFERINFKQVTQFITDELLKRGVNMKPSIYISSKLSDTSKVKLFFHNLSTEKQNFYNSSFVSLPLYPYEPENKSIVLEVGFASTVSFVIKQMTGLLTLSLFITVLIAFVMIYTFRRMLTQEKLNQIKNDFVNNMTHELKTPIATMSIALDAISTKAIKNDEEKLDNYTRILKEENKKLNTHVERVLHLAQLDSDELIINKEVINVAAMLQQCVDSHRLLIAEKRAEVLLETEVDLNLTGDSFHLQNAINNILDNALKYAHENPVIKIRAASSESNLILTFKDNGIGIDKSLKDKVFEKFFRVQSGNIHDVKGFGIGLSYVKSIIEAHSGTIELKSEINKGSEFIITLPLHGA